MLAPAIKFIAPAQTTCNYLSAHLPATSPAPSAKATANGNWLGAIGFEAPNGPNAESAPASAPANGPGVKNHLHFNPYPKTAAPGQDDVCEAGNERYTPGKTVIGPRARTLGHDDRANED